MSIERFGKIEAGNGLPVISLAAAHGGLVYLCGVTGDGAGDIRAQTRQVLQRIDGLLARSGSDRSRLLSVQVWLADMADFAAMNEIYAKQFPADPPARTTYAAAGLPKGARVEIEAVAIGRDL